MRPVTQKPTPAEREERRLAEKREKASRSAASKKGRAVKKQQRSLAIEAAIEAAKKRDGRQCRVLNCFRSNANGYEMNGAHLFGGRKGPFGDPTDPDGIITLCLEHHQEFDTHKSNAARIQWLVRNGFKNEARYVASRCGLEIYNGSIVQ